MCGYCIGESEVIRRREEGADKSQTRREKARERERQEIVELNVQREREKGSERQWHDSCGRKPMS